MQRFSSVTSLPQCYQKLISISLNLDPTKQREGAILFLTPQTISVLFLFCFFFRFFATEGQGVWSGVGLQACVITEQWARSDDGQGCLQIEIYDLKTMSC